MLKVIGAGFGRTGTFSLKNALEQIGYGPCYHMFEVFEHPEHVPHWQAAADGQNPEWETIFHQYSSAVDWPVSAFYKPLMAYYPDAKVILTVRNPEDWHRSVQNTIAKRNRDAEQVDDPLGKMVRAAVWDGIFDGRVADQSHAVSAFNRHVAEVKATVPADRLLVYEMKEGWDPLCRFLGVPVPQEVPFPYLNTTEEFQQRL